MNRRLHRQQGDRLWLGLEDYLLEHAATYHQRLIVFAGPVLAADDLFSRGVQNPLRFFKVAAPRTDGTGATAGERGDAAGAGLAAAGHLLDQTPQVDDVGNVLAQGAPPVHNAPVDAFTTRRRSLSDPTLDAAARDGSRRAHPRQQPCLQRHPNSTNVHRLPIRVMAEDGPMNPGQTVSIRATNIRRQVAHRGMRGWPGGTRSCAELQQTVPAGFG